MLLIGCIKFDILIHIICKDLEFRGSTPKILLNSKSLEVG